MLTRGRVLTFLGVLLVAIVAYGAWQAWSLYRDLDRVEQSADELRAALDSGDDEARDRAIADLQESADSASGNASSVWWDILSKLPVLGDDVEGLQVLSTTVDDVANEGLAPLADSLDRLDEVSSDGRVDVDVVRSMQDPVASANEVIGAASREVNGLDSGGFLGSLRTRYERYADILDDAASSLASADTAVRALPDMVGADGPRDYLLLFQNNAEIRATGGMPGSWAQIHAEDGRLKMTLQGTATDFPHTDEPVLPLTEEEVEIYGEEIGTYFQDPGFAPDFPRAAEIWRAHWDGKFPDTPIDGVLALDPVGMSYLLGGTGPVQVDGPHPHRGQPGRGAAQPAVPGAGGGGPGRTVPRRRTGHLRRCHRRSGLTGRLRRRTEPRDARRPVPGGALRRGGRRDPRRQQRPG